VYDKTQCNINSMLKSKSNYKGDRGEEIRVVNNNGELKLRMPFLITVRHLYLLYFSVDGYNSQWRDLMFQADRAAHETQRHR
jgi:hypothetical protein